MTPLCASRSRFFFLLCTIIIHYGVYCPGRYERPDIGSSWLGGAHERAPLNVHERRVNAALLVTWRSLTRVAERKALVPRCETEVGAARRAAPARAVQVFDIIERLPRHQSAT